MLRLPVGAELVQVLPREKVFLLSAYREKGTCGVMAAVKTAGRALTLASAQA